jgi:hypothetical protein
VTPEISKLFSLSQGKQKQGEADLKLHKSQRSESSPTPEAHFQSRI